MMFLTHMSLYPEKMINWRIMGPHESYYTTPPLSVREVLGNLITKYRTLYYVLVDDSHMYMDFNDAIS